MYYRLLPLLVLLIAGCGTVPRQAGFEPEKDAEVARLRAERPQDQAPEALAKQDPRTAYELDVDPRGVLGFEIITVPFPEDSGPLVAEMFDERRSYRRHTLVDIQVEGTGASRIKSVTLACREKQQSCDFKNAPAVPAVHQPKVWRAAVLNPETAKPERILKAVYRQGLAEFSVLVLPEDKAAVEGKELQVWSAYGDFIITLAGTLVSLANREVGKLTPEFLRAHPSRVTKEAFVPTYWNDPAGAYLLTLLSREFPLPAPFNPKGAASLDLLLGAHRLTPEENAWDCWVSNKQGHVSVSVFWQQALVETAISHLWSIHNANQPDCGKKAAKK